MNQGNDNTRDKASSLEIQDGQVLIGTYGTLMRGRSNHERFCSGYLDVQRVEIPGVLRWLSPTILMLYVHKGLILAMGTEDPFADVATQAGWFARFEAEGQPYQDGPNEAPQGHVRVVAGEVLGFDDPEARLPSIDRLEGFKPGVASLYSRVLLPVRLADSQVMPAWAYVAFQIR